jgi:diadenylate cyclase
VIIQRDRVAAAACFLPLTTNPRLSRTLGSRHRAAIGVTEENDSVAIVVSEETGKISLVENGDLESDVDVERLRARLKEVIRIRRGEQKRAGAGYSI